MKTGHGFQCYCPDKLHSSAELYEAQRDKITEDLNKLKTYQKELAARLGSTKLSDWVFVTPIIDRNALLRHARSKEIEVRGWNLKILASEFTIHLRDAEFYLAEITQVQSCEGHSITFDPTPPYLEPLNGPMAEYEGNLLRKAELRLQPKLNASNRSRILDPLYAETRQTFLEADAEMKRLEGTAPTVYARVLRVINEYEHEVVEKAKTWTGSAEQLTELVRDGLAKRIVTDLTGMIDETGARRISRHIVARWLAVCQLDFIS